MTLHYQEFAPFMNRFHVFTGQIHGETSSWLWAKLYDGGGFFIESSFFIIHSPGGENFSRIRNRRGRHLRVKICSGADFSLENSAGQRRFKGRTYNGTPATEFGRQQLEGGGVNYTLSCLRRCNFWTVPDINTKFVASDVITNFFNNFSYRKYHVTSVSKFYRGKCAEVKQLTTPSGNLPWSADVHRQRSATLVDIVKTYQLRVDLEDFEGNKAYAKYREFIIASAYFKFKMFKLAKYSGNAGGYIGCTSVVY